MERFINDDDGYLAWLRTHPRGYVVNCGNPPTASYVILHRASCHTITGTPATGRRWTAAYQKICADTASELYDWAAEAVGPSTQRCGTCLGGPYVEAVGDIKERGMARARFMGDFRKRGSD